MVQCEYCVHFSLKTRSCDLKGNVDTNAANTCPDYFIDVWENPERLEIAFENLTKKRPRVKPFQKFLEGINFELVEVCLNEKLMEKLKAKAEEWDLAIQDAVLKILKETLK